jgi:hypothetical protein
MSGNAFAVDPHSLREQNSSTHSGRANTLGAQA